MQFSFRSKAVSFGHFCYGIEIRNEYKVVQQVSLRDLEDFVRLTKLHNYMSALRVNVWKMCV